MSDLQCLGLLRAVRMLAVGVNGFLDAAGVVRVPVINFAKGLAARDADLGGIQHHDEIAGIDVRRVFRLVLAAQAHGDLGREASEYLVLGVHNVPTVDDILGFGAKSLHSLAWLSEKSREWYQR